MKKIIILLLCLVCIFLCACRQDIVIPDNTNDELPDIEEENQEPDIEVTPTIEYDYIIVSRVNSLNVRSNSTTSSSILGNIDKNDCLAYYGEKNGFYITKFKNQTAYISSNNLYSYLHKVEKASKTIENALTIGKNLLGTKYVYGAERYHFNGIINTNFSISAFDCSSFTQYIMYVSNDILLNATSRAQSTQGEFVEKSHLQRGDIMFFTNSTRFYNTGLERIGHVGIYFGNNLILHTASDYAVIEPISDTRWSYYIHSRRFL